MNNDIDNNDKIIEFDNNPSYLEESKKEKRNRFNGNEVIKNIGIRLLFSIIFFIFYMAYSFFFDSDVNNIKKLFQKEPTPVPVSETIQNKLDYLSEKIEEDPTNIQYYEERGNIYYDNERYKLAIQDFSSILKIDPNQYDAIYMLSFSYYLNSDFEESIDFAKKYLEQYPENMNSIFILADANFQLSNFNLAEIYYTDLIEYDPEDPYFYYSRAFIYYKISKYKEAIQDITFYIENYPTDFEAYYIRAYSNFELEEYQKALDDFIEISKINPKDSDAIYEIGFMYYIFGQMDEADLYYEKAASMDSRGAPPTYEIYYDNLFND